MRYVVQLQVSKLGAIPLVGYHRLSGELQCRLLDELYRVWSLWRNFFQPVMRLQSKIRQGSKVHRQYDIAQTPYQRLLDSKQLSAHSRESLQRQYDALNPIELMLQIQTRQDQLLRLIRKPQISASSPRHLSPRLVTSFVTQQPSVRLPK